MTQTNITVTRADVAVVAQLAFPDYRGPQHRVTVAETHEIRGYELCWDGGTRSQYVALRLSVVNEAALVRPGQWLGTWERVELTTVSPWSGDRWSGAIPDDVILVEHRHFCGRDMGLRYYVAPTSRFLAGNRHLLPAAPVNLTRAERVVLETLCSIKSSYRQEEYRRAGLSVDDVIVATTRLVESGLARRSRAGAVSATVAGQNARSALPRDAGSPS